MAIAIQLRTGQRYATETGSVPNFDVLPTAHAGSVMSTAPLWRFGMLLLVAGLATSPLYAQALKAQQVAGNGLVFQRVKRPNCDLGVAQFNGVMIVCEHSTDEQPPENNAPPDRDPSRQAIQITFRKGNLDQVI